MTMYPNPYYIYAALAIVVIAYLYFFFGPEA
jgi:hypothetical protein